MKMSINPRHPLFSGTSIAVSRKVTVEFGENETVSVNADGMAVTISNKIRAALLYWAAVGMTAAV